MTRSDRIRPSLTRRLALAAAALSLIGVPGRAIDARFRDADGDLIADTPADPKEQTDPATLIFAYTPVEDPEVYRKVWDEFIAHLAKETGRKVVFFPVQSNAAQIEAMRAGRLHIAGFNTGSVPLAVNCAGFAPFAMMASNKDEYGYEMEIIVQADGPIRKGRGSEAARTLAFHRSQLQLRLQGALRAAEIEIRAGGGPGLQARPSPASTTTRSSASPTRTTRRRRSPTPCCKRMVARKVVDGAKLRSIYKSQTFPTTAYGLAHNLKPELAAKIKAAFLDFKWEGTGLAKEFEKTDPPQQKFLPIVYRDTWAVVRDIDAAMGVSYACK